MRWFLCFCFCIVLCERLYGRLTYLCPSLVQGVSGRLVLSLPIPQWRWTIAEMSASVWTSSTSVQTFGAIIHPNSEFWQRIGQPYAHNQGDVLLPLSTLKRTVWPAVSTVADVVRLRGTAVKLSDEGGQATNSLPTMQYHK